MDTDLEAAFQKRDVYRYQREYRIAVNTGTEGCDPLLLSVGDLSDITFSPGTYWNISIDDVYDKLRSEVLAAEMLRAEVGG